MKKLNVTLNKNGDAKMMIMALLNGKLSLRMGRDDMSVITEIMSEVDPELSDEESKLIGLRLIDAVNKFHDIKRFCKDKDQKYDKLLQLVPSEVGKETSVMSLIYSDVSETYDTSELSTSEVSDVCCWLAAKSVLVKVPAMESLVAATSYKRRRGGGESQSRDNIIVLGDHDNKETDVHGHQNSSSDKNEMMDSGHLKNTDDVNEMISCLIGIILDDRREDIYHQILSEVEIDFIREDWDDGNKRLSSAIATFRNLDASQMGVYEKYRHLTNCLMTEIGQMPVLVDIYSDVSQMYDVSTLTVSGITEVLCWLIIFNLLCGEEPPEVDSTKEVRPKQRKHLCPATVSNNQPGKKKQSISSSETTNDVTVSNKYLTRGKNLNIFQAKDLRNSVSTGNFCASRMFSIFG